MVLSSDIRTAYLDQQRRLGIKSSSTLRSFHSEKKKTKGFIEVLSGIRRCGKSTLMKQLIHKSARPVAYFNFEDARVFGFDAGDFPKLDDVMGTGIKTYFFDEIQNVTGWELFVRQLHDRGEKIYITGSNASLLSKELGTRLTGRHIRHELFPFSYTEFLAHTKKKNSAVAAELYLKSGGFPEYLQNGNPEQLQHLLKNVVLRDIAVRYGIRNIKSLMELTLFLISNIGKDFSYHQLKKHFSIGSANSVSDYLTWLEDAYLLFFLPRFSYSAKSIAVNPRKVYVIDNGFAIANSLSFTEDRGRLLENAVFMHLRTKNANMFYYKENRECDFVIFEKGKCKAAIQVCELVDRDNKDRELNGLYEALIKFKLKQGYIITKNQKDELMVDDKKVFLLPLHEFLTKDLF